MDRERKRREDRKKGVEKGGGWREVGSTGFI
jgi:hypothetical protein